MSLLVGNVLHSPETRPAAMAKTIKCVVSMIALLSTCLTASANGQPPSQHRTSDALWGTSVEYRVLPRPEKPHSGHYVPAGPAPQIVAQPIQPYAYGWFGASGPRHGYPHFGYRRAYTQWTFK